MCGGSRAGSVRLLYRREPGSPDTPTMFENALLEGVGHNDLGERAHAEVFG